MERLKGSDELDARHQKTAQIESDATRRDAEEEARRREVADFIAHVRHEINNPLAALVGQTQLLLREELSDKARRRAETIEQLAGRIRNIVSNLRPPQRPQTPGDTDTPRPEEVETDAPRH